MSKPTRQFIRIVLAIQIAVWCLMYSGCGMTPQQVQIVAATTAATVAIAGNTSAAFVNNPKTQAKIQAAAAAAAQVAPIIIQAAGNWTPAPSPTPVPSVAPH